MAKVGALCFASFGDPGFFRSRWYFGDIWGGFWDSVQMERSDIRFVEFDGICRFSVRNRPKSQQFPHWWGLWFDTADFKHHIASSSLLLAHINTLTEGVEKIPFAPNQSLFHIYEDGNMQTHIASTPRIWRIPWSKLCSWIQDYQSRERNCGEAFPEGAFLRKENGTCRRLTT